MKNYSLDRNFQLGQDREIEDKKLATKDVALSLLEEKLVVKRSKRKIGEVVVRKEVETRTVHIPLRREKLIIEKVSATTEPITEIEVQQEEVNGIKFDEFDNNNDIYQAQSNFTSLESLQNMLNEIAARSKNQNIKLRLEIITDNFQTQQSCQKICARFTDNK